MRTQAEKIKDKLWVHYQGRIYAIPLAEKKAAHGASASEAEELIAPFSCKVLKIPVRSGQAVKKGEPVIVVEAMKMEYTYASPRDGIIEAILAKEGEIVPQGQHFVRWKDAK